MPVYKVKQFDALKIGEIVRVHPYMRYVIGMKEDWDMVHADLVSPDLPAVDGVRSSWWNISIMRIYGSNGACVCEMEVWKEIEYQDTEEHRLLQERLLEDWRRRKKDDCRITT